MTTREQDAAFRDAFDDVNIHARAIANYVVSGAPLPAELVDGYAQARGRLDRLVETMAGASAAANRALTVYL